MLDGPMMRRPLRRARATIATTSTSVPSTDVITMAPRMRLAMQASMVASRCCAGTATTARVTSSGRSVTVAWHGWPPSVVRAGLTAWTGTVASAVTLSQIAAPTDPGRSDAPITAIARGIRSRTTARESARCSRRSTLSRNSSVVASSQSRSTTPESKRRWSGQPALANTASIGRLSASTSAVNRSIPFDRAIAARCSSISVAMPSPWWVSSTMKAASASERPGHRS